MSTSELTSAIYAAHLFDGERWLDDRAVLLSGDTVVAIGHSEDIPAGLPYLALEDGVLAPGFVDLQVNGGGGVLLNNAPVLETVDRMTAAHRRQGTTAMLPTLLSDTPQVQTAGMDAVIAARAAGNRGALGIHIEGPCFNPNRRGTHHADMIRNLDETDLDWLCQARELPVLVTLAPEQSAPGQIRRLTEAGVKVSAGHTDANYEQLRAAIDEGLAGFTHLFNAMSPLAARAPGAVGAALDSDGTWVGVIADGHHVHPVSLRIAHRAKAPGRLLLVSDAMATVGSQDSGFELYGERIELKDEQLVNAEGALAGSAIGLMDAVRISHRAAGLPLAECLRMASLYPATALDMQHRLGRIAAGFRADLVHFDSQFRVDHTWVAGAHCQH